MAEAADATLELLNEGANDWVPLKVSCNMCPYVTFTARKAGAILSANEILKEHLEQHAPGRALDIAVDWEPSARCSVCESGGDIVMNDVETLICNECDTTWTLDGTDGERSE